MSAIKLVHTSDWHLGKFLYGQSLLEEQRERLGNWTAWIKDNAVTHVLIAGDIFDRPVPPEDAVTLFANTLQALTEQTQAEVFVIPGNHDSRVRVGAFSGLLKKNRIHICADPEAALTPLPLCSGKDGTVIATLNLFPYFEPQEWKHFVSRTSANALSLEEALVPSHQWALSAYLDLLSQQQNRIKVSPTVKRLLCVHLYVGGAVTSESERPLSIGGSELVSLSSFTEYDYVALGHLHRRQSFTLGRDDQKAVYCGSLFPYSWSEAGQVKSFEVLEIEQGQPITSQSVAFQGRRTLVTKTLSFDQALQEPPIEDYLILKISDAQMPLDAARRLKQHHPGLIHVSRELPDFDNPDGAESSAKPAARRAVEKSDAELLTEFALNQAVAPLTQDDMQKLSELWIRHQSESSLIDGQPNGANHDSGMIAP